MQSNALTYKTPEKNRKIKYADIISSKPLLIRFWALFILLILGDIIPRRLCRSYCFYSSDFGVGSYTSNISRVANRNPFVNACSSCLSEISASAFSNCSSRFFCRSVRAARSSFSRRTAFPINSLLSLPFRKLCSFGWILP